MKIVCETFITYKQLMEYLIKTEPDQFSVACHEQEDGVEAWFLSTPDTEEKAIY
tara:strand:+ start:41 stop:202 length:162 start_codon:yes stop_codon:yes gene_type:complete